MDAQTVSFYEARARDWTAQHRGIASPALEICNRWLRPGCTILDIGAGSGRDMAALLQGGFDVYGLEPAAALIAEAEAAFPLLKGRIARGSLPRDQPADRVFSAVLCSAVLMHVPAEEWFEAVYSLRRLLQPSGRAIVLVSTGRQVDPVTQRDDYGRLFYEPNPEAVQLLFERVGFKLLNQQVTPDRMGRAELTWHTFVFEWPSPAKLPPLDIIQRVIGTESKSARATVDSRQSLERHLDSA